VAAVLTIGVATVVPRPVLQNPASIPLSAGARTVRLRGVDGFAALSRSVDVDVERAPAFRMDLAVAAVDGVRVLHAVTTALVVRWPSDRVVEPSTVFVLPMEGELLVESPAGAVAVSEGVLVLSSDLPVVVTAARPVRFLLLRLPLPVSERPRRPEPPRHVPASSVTVTARTVLRAFLADLDIEHAVQAEYLKDAVQRLARVLGSERADAPVERMGLHDMVEAAEQVIRADHTDPTLDPGAVARRCRVSLRTLQRAVADERGTTLRDLLSSVRTESALRIVAGPDGAELPLSDVAKRSGFSSPERLRRAIATETGLSPSEYRRRLRDQERAVG
jgi:AraC-like DNA-binding protein